MYVGQDQDQQARTTNIDGGEILDEIITRSRGEIRHMHSPKVTSSTPSDDIKPYNSPQLSERAYSPRVNQLRMETSPGVIGKGLQSKKTPSPGPSTLGESSHAPSSF